MSEWWTYRLSDFLMFSRETYYRLFERYNEALWPWQLLTLVLAAVVIAQGRRKDRAGLPGTAAVLAGCWAVVAWLFHWERFREIHLAAEWFAGAFLVEGVLLLGWGLHRARRAPDARKLDRVGIAVFLFGVLLQPLIGPLLGRPWRSAEWFGFMPDPTITATLGLLLAARGTVVLWCIPLVYALVSAATLWTMNSPEAWVPLLVVLVCIGRGRIRAQGGDGGA